MIHHRSRHKVTRPTVGGTPVAPALFLGVTFLAAAASGQSPFGPAEPTATVTLRDGRTEVVRNLEWTGIERDRWRLNERWGCCAATADGPLQLAVPLPFVSAMTCADATCRVDYSFRGRSSQLQMKGAGRWIGKSRGGDFSADLTALASVRFEQPPIEELAWGLGEHDAVLELKGGRQVAGDHLLGVYEERFGNYVNNVRTGTSIDLRHNDVVFYVRGGQHRAVGFDQLRRLAFLASRQVEMTAADGSSAVADLDDDGDRRLVGLSGQYDRGFFYVALEDVVSVTFGKPAGTD